MLYIGITLCLSLSFTFHSSSLKPLCQLEPKLIRIFIGYGHIYENSTDTPYGKDNGKWLSIQTNVTTKSDQIELHAPLSSTRDIKKNQKSDKI
jgi:hypothetical protein